MNRTFLVAFTIFGALGAGVFASPTPPEAAATLPLFNGVAATRDTIQPLHNSDLLNHPWIGDFIFTRGHGPCPVLTHQMARLRGRLPDGFRLVSFSVDPDYDTPPVLQAYAKALAPAPVSWFFVHVDKKTLLSLIRGVVQSDETPEGGHSRRIILVDGQGKLRGSYDGLSGRDMRRLVRDAKALENHRGK